MNHEISAAIGEIIEARGSSLPVAEAVAKLKEQFSDAELEDFYKVLNFTNLEQAVQALINDIKG
jgi:uncharacterized protein (DUF433 family)